jgi:hypothetical protein
MRDEAQKRIKELHGSIAWVPREQNTRADELTRIAYSEKPIERTKPPTAYTMRGETYEFRLPQNRDEVRRLEWLANTPKIRDDWKQEAKRLLRE